MFGIPNTLEALLEGGLDAPDQRESDATGKHRLFNRRNGFQHALHKFKRTDFALVLLFCVLSCVSSTEW